MQYYTRINKQDSLLCSNMDEFQIVCWAKEARHKNVHTVYFNLCEVQKQATLISGGGCQSNAYSAWEDVDWEGGWSGFLGCWKCSVPSFSPSTFLPPSFIEIELTYKEMFCILNICVLFSCTHKINGLYYTDIILRSLLLTPGLWEWPMPIPRATDEGYLHRTKYLYLLKNSP